MFLRYIPVLVLVTCQIGFVSAETVKVYIQPVCQMDNGVTIYDKNIHVSLWEEDFSDWLMWNWFDSDDFFDDQQVQSGSVMQLEGSEVEVFSLEPYLLIRHDCFGYPRQDYVDLSRVNPDNNGIYNIGRFTISRNGYYFNAN